MNLQVNQNYEMDNLVTQYGGFRVYELQKAIMQIISKFKEYIINNGNYIITTTKSVKIVDEEQIMEVEILIPVTHPVMVNEPYTYKSKLKIVNALYTKVEDILDCTNCFE